MSLLPTFPIPPQGTFPPTPEKVGRNLRSCLRIFGVDSSRVPTRFLQEDIPTTSGLLIRVAGSRLQNGDPLTLFTYEKFSLVGSTFEHERQETCVLWGVHLVAIASSIGATR